MSRLACILLILTSLFLLIACEPSKGGNKNSEKLQATNAPRAVTLGKRKIMESEDPGSAKARSAQVQELVDQARTAYEYKDYEKAIELYDKALEQETNHYWKFDKANCLYFLGRYEEAGEIFSSYRRWDSDYRDVFPKTGYALYNAACCYSLLEQGYEAFLNLDEALFAGFDDQELLANDPDLSYIRRMPRFDKYFPPVTTRKNVRPDFPIQYAEEPLEFAELEKPDLPHDDYLLVASGQARLYQGTQPGTDEEAAQLEPVEVIPYLTLLPIFDEIMKEDTDYYCDLLFEFEGDTNYFYKTEYNGKKGFVWGADLTGFEKTKTELLRLKYYYSKQKKAVEFHAFNGYKDVPEKFLGSLQKHHLVAELVGPDEYRLSTDYPDDLLALYSRQSEIHSAFYTTDLFIHVYHLLFDNMLQEIEIRHLSPRLMSFVQKMIEALETREVIEQYPVKAAESADFLLHYFRIGEALLKMAPPLEKYGARFEESEEISQKQIRDIISSYSNIEQKELNYLMDAKRIVQKAPLFDNYCDYSLYKPRGHYSKNQYLQAYFRAMMWFGNRNFDYPKDDLKKSRFRESVLLYDLVQNNKELYQLWSDLFDPISYLIGASENVTIHDFDKMGFSRAQISSFFENEQSALESMKNLLTVKEQEIDDYNPIYDLSTKKNALETPGFRLFSQRFTLDSFIHSLVTAPEIEEPRNVSGLDIMAAFGSKEALQVLPEYHKASASVVEQLEKANKMVNAVSKDFWQSNFYNSYLDMIGAITHFDQSENFYYTHSNKWDRKSLIASLGAWTELRHDTLLYVKQYGAEAGCFPRSPSYRTEKVELPVQYIEANLGFFYKLQDSLIFLYDLLVKYDLLLPVFREKIVDFNEVLNLVVQVVELEVRDMAIGEELNRQILSIPHKLATVVLPVTYAYNVYLEEAALQKALIVDVFTNPSSKEVLEVATGRPVRLYVALNDGDGGKRIATGYGYSYYEFMQPPGQRLDDEQWKTLVYDKYIDLSEKMPLWEKEYLEP